MHLLSIGILGMALAQGAWAVPYGKVCGDLLSCVRAVGQITGDRYVYSTDLSGTVGASDNLDINRENATLLLTQALEVNGYTRVPLLGERDTYRVVPMTAAGETLLPTATADYDTRPKLPGVWDWYRMTYRAKSGKTVEAMAQLARQFLPEAARVVPLKETHQLHLVAAAPDLKKIYSLLRDLDLDAPSLRRKKHP